MAQTDTAPTTDKYRGVRNALKSLTGQGAYRDTGRNSSGPGEIVDSYIGGPVRQAISDAQDGNISLNAIKARIGADPKAAPSGYDIASKVTDNPYLGTAMATAVDVGSQLPAGLLPEGLLPAGVMGEIKGVKDAGNIADATEAFAARGKTPASADVKAAQLRGETGDVRDAVPKLLQNAKQDMNTAQAKKNYTGYGVEQPETQVFWDNENDHSFTDDAKKSLNSIVARTSDKEQPQMIKALEESHAGPDNQPYQSTPSQPKWISGLPNFSARPTGQIGDPGIANSVMKGGGNPEPFPWMDSKFGAGKQLLLRHKSLDMPADIHTSSDLIGRDDYINAIPKGSTVNIHFGPSDPEVLRDQYPGNPSNLRLENAAQKLEYSGIKVNRVYPDNTRGIKDKPRKGD